ncbi:hypothetical protein HPB47_022034 [Ixodes persulcatus]|uniref:Uncharacterized protein n=1 Tax=Ixodes persulcatus TaxID=34615 RepID=A0AC60QAY0_IXOPE|nr:hypothetical protein HPB47_022034 [Ixodes persulcatus]
MATPALDDTADPEPAVDVDATSEDFFETDPPSVVPPPSLPLLIAQAAFACPLSRKHDPADRYFTVPLSSLKTTQGNVSGTTFHADSEDNSRNKRLVFDESTRSASTSTVAYEATKGLSERFAIRRQGSTHVCTMSNPLIFFTQGSSVETRKKVAEGSILNSPSGARETSNGRWYNRWPEEVGLE